MVVVMVLMVVLVMVVMVVVMTNTILMTVTSTCLMGEKMNGWTFFVRVADCCGCWSNHDCLRKTLFGTVVAVSTAARNNLTLLIHAIV